MIGAFLHSQLIDQSVNNVTRIYYHQTDVMHSYIVTLNMTATQVVETSVTVSKSRIQDCVHLDDHTYSIYI